MASAFQIFEPAYTFIDGKLPTVLNADVSNVIAQVSGPLRAALVLYVLLYGFAILRGSISEPIMDFAIRSLKLAFIYMLATSIAAGPSLWREARRSSVARLGSLAEQLDLKFEATDRLSETSRS